MLKHQDQILKDRRSHKRLESSLRKSRLSNTNKSFELSKTNLIGYSSLGMLGLLSLAMLLPVSSTDTHAEGTTDTFSANVNTNVAALVRSSISVGVSSKVNLDLTPSSKGSFSSGIANLSVSTNNTTGYSIYLRTPDDTASLLPAQSGVEQTIGRVNGTMSEDNYASNLNTWGYSISNTKEATSVDNTLYQAIPLSSDPAILSQDTTDQEDNYALSLGVAISPTLPAGMYTNELIVSVVAHPIEVRSLSDITTMQEMTPEICKISYENETKQLTDTRDGNSYWVAKLKDGNCWMVQNLALTFGDGMTDAKHQKVTKLTSNDSDLNSKTEWTPQATEQTDTHDVTNQKDNNGIESWSSLPLADSSDDPQWYYQWNTATAGSGASITDKSSAVDSICPKNWQLPGSNNKDYAKLFDAYGIKIGNDESDAEILKAPLNFTRSGCVWNSSIVHISNGGYYWTNQGSNQSPDYAIYLAFNNSLLNVGYQNARYNGMSVRCVAR